MGNIFCYYCITLSNICFVLGMVDIPRKINLFLNGLFIIKNINLPKCLTCVHFAIACSKSGEGPITFITESDYFRIESKIFRNREQT